jgi:predicted dehydrogenase
MNRKIRWGVLGTAAIAVQRTMPAMHAATRATLLAVASRDAGKAQQVAQALSVPRAYGSYEALLADPDIDAIYLPLPNQMHFDWSMRALEAGKHVLCEKPLCLRAADVEALCRVRERSGRVIEEGFAFRNHPQWATLAGVIADGEIGTVRSVHAMLAKQFLDPADIRNNPAAGGGALYDLGSYAISACNLVFGRLPQRVVAAIDRDPRFGIDRLTSALFDYGDSHATFTVGTQSGSASWATSQQFNVLGSRGWLRCNFPFAHARPTACQMELGDESSVGALPTRRIDFEPADHYQLQIERFSRLLLGEAVPAWPIETALDTLRLIEALQESARSGAWQAL